MNAAFSRIFACADAHMYEDVFAASINVGNVKIALPPGANTTRRGQSGNLSAESAFVLRAVNDHDMMTSADITKLGIPKNGWASDSLRALKDGGYVTAAIVKRGDDGCINRYSITDHGRRWVANNSA